MTYLRAVLDEASARYRGTRPFAPWPTLALLAVVVIAEDLIGG